MKNNITKPLLLFVLLLLSVNANAYDFEYNNLHYTIVSIPERTVEVAFGNVAYRGKVVVPSHVMYKDITWDVVGLGQNAFAGSLEMTELILPECIKFIKWGALDGCNNIKNIYLPAGITLEAWALTNSGMQTLRIPKGTKWNGDNIGQLGRMKQLTSVVFEEGVDSIPNWLCTGDVNLTNVVLPQTLKHIGMFAFEDCKSLKAIDIPPSVASIDTPIFNSKCGVVKVIVHWEEPINIEDKTFPNGTYMNATLVVPKGTTELYRSSPGWRNFMTIVEAAD